MRTTVEALTANFYEWEVRGRGWQTYPFPVGLEPPFRPFPGHLIRSGTIVDDGRKPTIWSGLWEALKGRSLPAPPVDNGGDEVHERAVPPAGFDELEILVPPKAKIDPRSSEAWFQAISGALGRTSFELMGFDGQVTVRLAAERGGTSLVVSQARSFFPGATVQKAPPLRDAWRGQSLRASYALEFGLAHEFMLPLRTFGSVPDPLSALVGALAATRHGEVAVLQVLFEDARCPWASSALAAVTAPDGRPFFLDAPQLTSLAQEKCSSPLYAVALRVAAGAESHERAWALLRGLSGTLAQHGAPDRNELVPLASEDSESVVQDILAREAHRSGMILSLAELSSIARLPGEHTRSPALVRVPKPQAILPAEVRGQKGVILGVSVHRGTETAVRVSEEARLQHLYVIGGTGTGKSTLLEQLILQDIASGAGVGVLDPHGDLVDDILGRIPDDRLKDVILFDPADPGVVVGWNILGAHSQVEKDLLASDLVAAFRRLSMSWGDQINVVLANAVMAFLESDRGGTLSDLRRFLLDDDYRAAFLSTVRDPHVASFWNEEYPLLVGRRPQAPILTRLDTFLRSRLVREAVTEASQPLNFREMIDGGRIFLGKLSQGAIGQENAALLGTLLVSKFHQVGLSRQDTAQAARRPFYLYVDEFQHMATPSMASLFSGVRKYGLGLTVAHQDLYQLHAEMPELERAILANAFTRVMFRVSDDDARKLAKGTEGFAAEDLTNLGRGKAICRVGQGSQTFRLTTHPLEAISPEVLEGRRREARRASLERYGRPREAPGRYEPLPERESRPRASRAVPSVPPAPTPAPAPIDPGGLPGRGGAVHKYVQGLITEWGRAQGFRAEIEMQLPDGRRVDVALTRGALRIACEVAGTTSIEQEVGNIEKCVGVPFDHVVAVSLDRSFLRRLDEALPERLTGVDLSRVSTLSPEEFLSFLRSLGPEMSESRVRGYVVKIKTTPGAVPADQSSRKAVADVMLRSVKRVRGENP